MKFKFSLVCWMFTFLVFIAQESIAISNQDVHNWHPTGKVNHDFDIQQRKTIDTAKYRLPQKRFETIKQVTNYISMALDDFGPEIDVFFNSLMSQVLIDGNWSILKDKSKKCNYASSDIKSIRKAWRNLKTNVKQGVNENCPLCMDVFGLIKFFACSVDYEVARDSIIKLCETLLIAGGSTPDMCNGTITNQAPYIVTTLTESQPYDFCESLNVCTPPPEPTSTSVSRKIQNILNSRREHQTSNQEQRKSPRSRTKIRENTIKMVQLADIHIQPKYAQGSPVDCNMYVCCMNDLVGTGQARKYGEHSCNIPERTMHLFLDKVAAVDPDFIIFSGDAPPHTIWDESLVSQLNCSDITIKALKAKLPGKTIYPNFGNHEMYPTNIYSMLVNQTSFINDALTTLWQDLAGFSEAQEITMRHLLYYTTTVPGHSGLRVLSINTNHYWYTLNFMATLNRNMTEDQIHRDFIINTLTEARNKNEKVIVVGHHPVGSIDSIVRTTRWWESVAIDFSDVIIMTMSGHTHNDEFHLFMDPATSDAVGINYVAPPMTANTDVNPSMRVYYLDDVTYEVVDFESYYMELDDQMPSSPPNITVNYNPKALYELNDLSPNSWKDLSIRFLDDDLIFQTWYSNRFSKALDERCDGECKVTEICRLWFPNYDEIQECVDIMISEPSTSPTPPSFTSGETTEPQTGTAAMHVPLNLIVIVSIMLAANLK